MQQVPEQYFRDLVDSSPSILWVTRPDGYCTYLSKQWYDFTGRNIEDDLGLGWTENIHPEDKQAAGEEFIRCSNAQIHYEVTFRLRRKDGVYRWVMDKGHPRYDEKGEFQGFVGTVIDIHEQKQTEQDLNDLKERFMRVATATNLGVFYCDLPFAELIWNPEVKNHFWIPDIKDRITLELFYAIIHPEDRKMTENAINTSIQNKTPYDVVYRTVNPKNESEIKHVRAVGWTDYNKSGEPIRFDGITLDVSEEIQLKDNTLKALSSRDEFVSVASHELKTPLTSLQLQAQLLKKQLQKTDFSIDKVIDLSERSEAQIKRLTRLVEDMMDISRIQTGKLTLSKEQMDMGQVIQDVLLKLTPDFIRANVPIPHLEFPKGIKGQWDPLRIEQVLNNLITNALRYGKGTPINIKLDQTPDLIRVSVDDLGPGIEKELLERIFNRFERAISPNEVAGLGIGLYISKQIIESHGGRIWVESEVGKGARFIFELPRH